MAVKNKLKETSKRYQNAAEQKEKRHKIYAYEKAADKTENRGDRYTERKKQHSAAFCC